ncbi:hypothetical protein STEG23_015030, partial [Scotinomys teguina]
MAGNAWLWLQGQARVVQELWGTGEWGLVSGKDAAADETSPTDTKNTSCFMPASVPLGCDSILDTQSFGGLNSSEASWAGQIFDLQTVVSCYVESMWPHDEETRAQRSPPKCICNPRAGPSAMIWAESSVVSLEQLLEPSPLMCQLLALSSLFYPHYEAPGFFPLGSSWTAAYSGCYSTHVVPLQTFPGLGAGKD